MTPCILPAVGKTGFVLNENEIEIGMGIQGEPSVERSALEKSYLCQTELYSNRLYLTIGQKRDILCV